MRVPLTHQKLIGPQHALSPDAPVSSSIVRKRADQELREERPERSGAVAVSTLKPCNKCGKTRNDTRAGLCDACAFPKKPKAEAVIRVNADALIESRLNEADEDSVGIFIKLPEDLASQWPKNPKDPSPPHVTMLYVGKCSGSELVKVREALRDVAQEVEPFTLCVSDYGEFVSGKTGDVIPHMVPRVLTGECELGDLHRKLWDAVEKRGITVDHFSDGPFKPHITLGYLKPGAKAYDGPRPAGRFAVRYLELWVGDEHTKVPLGKGARGGPEPKPKGELVTDALSESAFEDPRYGARDGGPGTIHCNECGRFFAYSGLHEGVLMHGGARVGICDGPDEWWCAECGSLAESLSEARKPWRKADLNRKARSRPRFDPEWLDDDHYVASTHGWAEEPYIGATVDSEFDFNGFVDRTEPGRAMNGETVVDYGPGWMVVRVDWR